MPGSRAERDSKAFVTPPRVENVTMRMTTIPMNMIPACRASLYMTAMIPP